MSSDHPHERKLLYSSLYVGNKRDPSDPSCFHHLFEDIHREYEETDNIFSPDGVDLDKLELSMRYIALGLHHDIKMVSCGSHTRLFYCAFADSPKLLPEKQRREKTLTDERRDDKKGKQTEKTDQKEVKRPPKGCGFFFHFCMKKGLWVLKNDSRNSIGLGCEWSDTPSICMHSSFIARLIRHYLSTHPPCEKKLKLNVIREYLFQEFSLLPNGRTLDRAWREAKEKYDKPIQEKVPEIEKYMRDLNEHGQYGVLLYSNGDLIVPTPNGKSSTIRCFSFLEDPGCVYPCSLDSSASFWDHFPSKEREPGEKSVRMTFQAVSAATTALQFSFPVICLDAYTNSTIHSKGVIFTATFCTTERQALPFCIGTAEREDKMSWVFFLCNIRYALIRYCPALDLTQLVFMSDRRKPINDGVGIVFPDSHHLCCIASLIRRITGLRKGCWLFFNASEAESEGEFNRYFRELVESVPRAALLYEMKDSWASLEIQKKCKRFGIRTSCWAEMQNTSFQSFRKGDILITLMKSFQGTSKKVKLIHEHAVHLQSQMPNPHFDFITEYATRVINEKLEKSCKENISVARVDKNKWIIGETGKEYTVILHGRESSCTCQRYFEEGIPCIHMLLVLKKKYKIARELSLSIIGEYIDPIYTGSQLLKAFPPIDFFIPRVLSKGSEGKDAFPIEEEEEKQEESEDLFRNMRECGRPEPHPNDPPKKRNKVMSDQDKESLSESGGSRKQEDLFQGGRHSLFSRENHQEELTTSEGLPEGGFPRMDQRSYLFNGLFLPGFLSTEMRSQDESTQSLGDFQERYMFGDDDDDDDNMT